ncbi:hypothetical protein ACFYX5_34750 [Streptomyces rubiginosohelvolus]|uniref:hypothetical protein n=1 Tax=Streptomyces rubiginosohelvolus TaxID=67362 RepID=UPI0036AA6BA0
MASVLLAAGWPVPLLWEVIARPLPEPLRRTVGAVISGRLKAAAAMPVPGSAAGTAAVPHQAPGPDRTARGEERRWEDGPTPTLSAWADLEHQQEQLRRGIDRHPVCEADDGRCPTIVISGQRALCAGQTGCFDVRQVRQGRLWKWFDRSVPGWTAPCRPDTALGFIFGAAAPCRVVGQMA